LADVADELPLAEVAHQQIRRRFAFRLRLDGQLARVQQRLLVIHKGVAHVLDRNGLQVGAGLSAGVQRLLLFQVLLEGAVGIIPRPELLELSPDLLGPHAGRMRKDGEVEIGLGGFAWAGVRNRMVWATAPQNRFSCGFGRDVATVPATVMMGSGVKENNSE
jgi:hypothetical protein